MEKGQTYYSVEADYQSDCITIYTKEFTWIDSPDDWYRLLKNLVFTTKEECDHKTSQRDFMDEVFREILWQ